MTRDEYRVRMACAPQPPPSWLGCGGDVPVAKTALDVARVDKRQGGTMTSRERFTAWLGNAHLVTPLSEAARQLDWSPATVRRWVITLNAAGAEVMLTRTAVHRGGAWRRTIVYVERGR